MSLSKFSLDYSLINSTAVISIASKNVIATINLKEASKCSEGGEGEIKEVHEIRREQRNNIEEFILDSYVHSNLASPIPCRDRDDAGQYDDHASAHQNRETFGSRSYSAIRSIAEPRSHQESINNLSKSENDVEARGNDVEGRENDVAANETRKETAEVAIVENQDGQATNVESETDPSGNVESEVRQAIPSSAQPRASKSKKRGKKAPTKATTKKSRKEAFAKAGQNNADVIILDDERVIQVPALELPFKPRAASTPVPRSTPLPQSSLLPKPTPVPSNTTWNDSFFSSEEDEIPDTQPIAGITLKKANIPDATASKTSFNYKAAAAKKLSDKKD